MAAEPLAPMRACRKCAVEKPHDRGHFTIKLGKLTPLCRECNAADCKIRYEANREVRQAQNRERWRANSERYHETQRRHYRGHIEERRDADRRYREANPEKRKAAHLAWRMANPKRFLQLQAAWQRTDKGRASLKRRGEAYRERHRERLLVKRREGYRENADFWREYHRQWYAANRVQVNSNKRAWRAANRAKVAEFSHRRRIANGSGIRFTSSDVEIIYAEQDGLCTYCTSPLGASFEVDHFIPVARGGGHEPENIVIACMPCNRSKGCNMPWVWRPDLFRAP